MSESKSEDPKMKEIKDRFGGLQARIHNLLVEFIYWNDVFRYPDLPEDSERPGRLAAAQRNFCNEQQIRYLGIAKEDSIILNLWALLYDVGEHSEQNILRLGERLNNPPLRYDDSKEPLRIKNRYDGNIITKQLIRVVE